MPLTEKALLIRTDFVNEETWREICRQIGKPISSYQGASYQAQVELISDKRFQNLSAGELRKRVPLGYPYSFLFVVDKTTISDVDLPILVVDLQENSTATFRSIPSQIVYIESNLSIANLSFSDFAEAVDKHGVYRGDDPAR